MIAALFVIKDGIYYNLPGVDPWDKSRDARKYQGSHPVIAHPPCERWGRYFSGGPMLAKTKKRKLLGNDEGLFYHALWAVRTFGGVIEHPEASHAWPYFGLKKPPRSGGWIGADSYGGMTCCVAQGNYGHSAQKLTWLYGININLSDLRWGLCKNKTRLEQGFHSKEEREKHKLLKEKGHTLKMGTWATISKKERIETPERFRDLLISLIPCD